MSTEKRHQKGFFTSACHELIHNTSLFYQTLPLFPYQQWLPKRLVSSSNEAWCYSTLLRRFFLGLGSSWQQCFLTDWLSSSASCDSTTATVSRDECLHLNDILGSKTLSSCYNLKHTLSNRDDSFHTSRKISEDDSKHRNSWLMPRMARRMTTKSRFHVTQWRPDVKVDDSDCAKLRALLVEKMGSLEDAEEHLPAACKRMEH